MLQYALLHLSGYDLPLEEIRAFRQWGSRTPGHPERGHTPGVETTTGPLGQGVGNAVGMAIAERRLGARLFEEFKFTPARAAELVHEVLSPEGGMTNPLVRLGELGREDGRLGMTTNPTIFEPRYPDVHYVEPLIAPDTVNTLPPETFAAYRDHGRPEARIEAELRTAEQRRAELAAVGIDLADVTARLEAEGVSKFAASYESLLKGIESKMEELAVK